MRNRLAQFHVSNGSSWWNWYYVDGSALPFQAYHHQPEDGDMTVLRKGDHAIAVDVTVQPKENVIDESKVSVGYRFSWLFSPHPVDSMKSLLWIVSLVEEDTDWSCYVLIVWMVCSMLLKNSVWTILKLRIRRSWEKYIC